MSRPPYEITADDYTHARDYLERHDLDVEGGTKKQKAQRLSAWAIENLSPVQWDRLRSAIRKRRQRLRQGDSVTTVTMSRTAHQLLSRLANRDGVTMSQVVEKYLARMPKR